MNNKSAKKLNKIASEMFLSNQVSSKKEAYKDLKNMYTKGEIKLK